MEVLAAVASVAGVLSLTIDGIETIGKLKAFCDDFKTSNKLASEFFHELDGAGNSARQCQRIMYQVEHDEYCSEARFSSSIHADSGRGLHPRPREVA